MILGFGTTPAIARTMRFASLRTGGVNRAAEVYTYAAGKAVNAARAIRTLGGEVICAGVEGGMLGNDLLALLDRDGFNHRFLRVDSPTRLCVTAIDDASRAATELIEDASPLTQFDGTRLLAALEAMLAGVRVAVFSGSLARGLGDDFYARCVRSAHQHGVAVLLDASGAALREAIPEKPELVKINAHELAGLTGAEDFAAESELLAQSRALAARSGGRVIITRGAEATLAVDAAGNTLLVDSLAAEHVVSPIGCGDSFAGGAALAIARGESFADCLSLGTACAMANLETPHAAHFESAAVDRWRTRVHVRAAPFG